MPDCKVLWVDDQLIDNTAAVPIGGVSTSDLAQWENKWIAELALDGVRLHIIKRTCGSVADDLTREQFNALILDYELDSDPRQPDSNAFKLLERLRHGIRRTLPPVAIFSRYSASELRAHLRGQIRGDVWAVYEKTAAGAQGIVSFLKNTVLRGPLNFVLISDFHAGFLAEAGGIDHEDFLHSLSNDIEGIAASLKLDGLIIPGDLAWRTQSTDLTRAYLAMSRLASSAKLDRPEQVVFCPGNHDLDLSPSAEPWRYFGQFVDLLTQCFGEQYSSRFVVAWNSGLRKRGRFNSQTSLLSIVHDAQRGVVFVCLNSCKPTGQGHEVLPEVDGEQWSWLERALEAFPRKSLRIALLHHPIFSIPGGVHKDDPALADQGKAMQVLAKLGIGLVLHGHCHFAGIHSHRIRILNGAPQGRKMSKILSVACPSVIAHPSSTSPHRQYIVLRLDAFNEMNRTRGVLFTTRVFNPADCTWSAGEEIGLGEFDIDSME